MTKNKYIDIDKLLERNATENANIFGVPDGYFDSLQERVIANIEKEGDAPQKAKIVSILSWRKIRWVAACACLLIVGITSALYSIQDSDVAEDNDLQFTDYHADALIDAAEYTMLDSQDMYHLLADDDI